MLIVMSPIPDTVPVMVAALFTTSTLSGSNAVLSAMAFTIRVGRMSVKSLPSLSFRMRSNLTVSPICMSESFAVTSATIQFVMPTPV